MSRVFWALPRLVLLLALACVTPEPEPDKPQDPDPEADADADGWTLGDGDCDDADATIHPEAEEDCDGVDDDCDGTIDDSTVAAWYADTDGDGFGDPDAPSYACVMPEGYVANGNDCDDAAALALPGGIEVCDELDNDCDLLVDEEVTSTFYTDADGDGAGDPLAPVQACEQGWHAPQGDDCDDADPAAYPGFAEVCDGIDNDCDRAIDDGVTTVYYTDADGDGAGDPDAPVVACEQGADALRGDDCDDADPARNPGAVEVCNGLDDDCDGAADEPDAADASTWFADADADGFGDPLSPTSACTQPTAFVADATDCDDGDAADRPDADEVCDGDDDDCDGVADEADAVDAPLWYRDADADTFGDASTGAPSCTAPAGTVADAGDCDDTDAAVSPAGTEVCGGADEDCDGATDEDDASDAPTWYADADADAYGDATTGATACLAPAGRVADATDCDDTDPATSPGDAETCDDGVDQDCDGAADDGCPVEHCGTLTADETWSGDVEHHVTCDVNVGGSGTRTLTIEDGARVEFAPGTGLVVGDPGVGPGRLYVEGSTLGVTLTSSEAAPAPGDWDGVSLLGACSAARITAATIEYGGGNGYGNLYLYDTDSGTSAVVVADSTIADGSHSGVYAGWQSTLDLSGSTVADNAEDGVHATAQAALHDPGLPSFTDNTLTGNGAWPLRVHPDSLGLLDDSSSFVGNGADEVFVHAGSVTRDASWPALDVPYFVDGDVYVQSAAAPTVLVGDGASFVFDTGVAIYVGWDEPGALDVRGTTLGVSFGSAAASPAAGDWSGLGFGEFDAGSILVGATVEYAGSNGSASVYVLENTNAVTITDSAVVDGSASGIYAQAGLVEIADTDVSDNAETGVYLDADSTVSGAFTGNTLSGNGSYPLRVSASELAHVDATNTFGGNTFEYVQVLGGRVVTDGTWSDLSAPYRVVGNVLVTDGATLTIAPGTSLGFDTSVALSVGATSTGTLYAVGTSTDPITFTSAQPVPSAGDWAGLAFWSLDGGSTLQYVVVEYAGSAVGNVYFNRVGGTTSITDSTVRHSDAYGIYRTLATPTISGITYSDNNSGNLY